MKRILMGAAIMINAAVAPAQPVAPEQPVVNVPPAPVHKCEPRPEHPGRLGMTIDSRRRQFDRELKSYRDCMLSFIEERKAVIKANETSARAAIDEFNSVMTKLKEEQEAAKQ